MRKRTKKKQENKKGEWETSERGREGDMRRRTRGRHEKENGRATREEDEMET